MKDPIISVKDLLAECVRKAVLIIICGIVFAIALSGFKFYKDSRALNNLSQDMEVVFTDAQKVQIANYVNVVNQWNGLSEYMQESVYINANPYAVDCIQIQYKIDSDSESLKRDAVFSLRAYLVDGGLADDLSKNVDLEARYIKELIKCESVTNESQIDNSVLQLTVYAENEEIAQDYAVRINECVNAYIKNINSKGITCKVQKLDERQMVVVDSKMVEDKTTKMFEYTELGKTINDLSAGLSVEQIGAANSILDSKLHADVSTTDVVRKASFSVKYFVLGGILGCAIAVVWIAIVYIFTNTVKTEKDVQDMVGISSFGYLTCKKMNFFDQLANKIFYPADCFELDKQKESVISKIAFCCKRQDIKELILINSELKDAVIIEQMKAELSKNGIEVRVFEHFSIQNESVKTKDVVLVNQINKTKYQDVENTVLFCKNQDINVLGYITVM